MLPLFAIQAVGLLTAVIITIGAFWEMTKAGGDNVHEFASNTFNV
jgi:hypothetical protein